MQIRQYTPGQAPPPQLGGAPSPRQPRDTQNRQVCRVGTDRRKGVEAGYKRGHHSEPTRSHRTGLYPVLDSPLSGYKFASMTFLISAGARAWETTSGTTSTNLRYMCMAAALCKALLYMPYQQGRKKEPRVYAGISSHINKIVPGFCRMCPHTPDHMGGSGHSVSRGGNGANSRGQ
jgi:hypothetical protein